MYTKLITCAGLIALTLTTAYTVRASGELSSDQEFTERCFNGANDLKVGSQVRVPMATGLKVGTLISLSQGKGRDSAIVRVANAGGHLMDVTRKASELVSVVSCANLEGRPAAYRTTEGTYRTAAIITVYSDRKVAIEYNVGSSEVAKTVDLSDLALIVYPGSAEDMTGQSVSFNVGNGPRVGKVVSTFAGGLLEVEYSVGDYFTRKIYLNKGQLK